jgi:hypothetical protein
MQSPSRRFILLLGLVLVAEGLAIELLAPRFGIEPIPSIVATVLVAGLTAYAAASLRRKTP